MRRRSSVKPRRWRGRQNALPPLQETLAFLPGLKETEVLTRPVSFFGLGRSCGAPTGAVGISSAGLGWSFANRGGRGGGSQGVIFRRVGSRWIGAPDSSPRYPRFRKHKIEVVNYIF